jgi:hypothetical protein
MMANRRAVCTILALLAFGGCTQRQPGEYALPINEAYARLAASNLPDLIRVGRCGIPVSVNRSAEPPGTITWYVLSDDIETVRLVAYLSPLPENKTRVSLAIWNDAHGDKAYDGSQFYRRPALRQPLRPLMDEQIAAILEQRPFDNDVQPRMADGSSDSVCNVQGAGRDTFHFSLDDDLDSSDTPRPRPRAIDRRSPGAPDPSAGRPTVHVTPGGR